MTGNESDTSNNDKGESPDLHSVHYHTDVVRAAARVLMDAAFQLIQDDPHLWSSRPCATCGSVSSIIGRPFGCVLRRSQVPPTMR